MCITSKKSKGKQLFHIYCTVAVILGIVLVICGRKAYEFSVNQQILLCLLYVFVAIIVGFLLTVIYGVVWIIKNGYFNAKFSRDPVFRELDQLKQCYHICEETVLRQIQMINWYYKPDGEVDRMIDSGGVHRILERQELLENRTELADKFSSTLMSAGHAVLITVFFQFYLVDEAVIMVPAEIVSIILFFALMFLKYAFQREGKTYLWKVDSYELDCLQEKIRRWKTKFSITDAEMEILKAQQGETKKIRDLMYKARKRKRRTEIEQDLDRLESLNLLSEKEAVKEEFQTMIEKYK